MKPALNARWASREEAPLTIVGWPAWSCSRPPAETDTYPTRSTCERPPTMRFFSSEAVLDGGRYWV